MIHQYKFSLPPYPRGFHIVTREVLQNIPTLPEIGIFHLFIKHTSAGLTIIENADPSVLDDYESYFNTIVKENEPFLTHTIEGPDDMPAHIKSTLVGSSVTIPISDGRLDFGTWQGIFLCEFRYKGGSRKLVATIYS